MIRRPNPEHIGVLKNFFPLVKTIDNIVRFYGEELFELWPEYPRAYRLIGHMFEAFMDPDTWANSLNEARYMIITRLSKNIIRKYNKAKANDLRRQTNYKCVICLGTSSRNLIRIFCKHRFHKKCIKDYHAHAPGRCPFRCHMPTPVHQARPIRDEQIDNEWDEYRQFARERNYNEPYANLNHRVFEYGPRRDERVGAYVVHTVGRFVVAVTSNGPTIHFRAPVLYRHFMTMREDYTGVNRLQWDEEKISDHIIWFTE